MSGEIAKLFVTLGLDDKQFQTNMKRVQRNATIMAKQMTVLGVAITAALGLSVHRFAATGDEIQTMAIKTGFSARALSELKYIAERSGTSFETLQTAIKNVAKLLDDSSRGSIQATETLRRLGLELKDFEGLSPEEAFWLLAEAIRNVEDPMKRLALAQDVFGQSGIDLMAIINLEKDELQKLKDRAHELGVVLDEEAAAKAAALSDAFFDLKAAITGIQMIIGSLLADKLMPLVNMLTNVISAVSRWAQANPELAGTLVTIVGALGATMAILGPLLMMLPAIAAGFSWLVGVVGSASAALAILFVPALVVIAVTAWISAIQSLGKYWGDIWWGMKRVAENVLNTISALLNKIPGVNLGTVNLTGTQPEVELTDRAKKALGMPGFAAGGIVPGPLGSPVPVMAHGGEAFLGVGNSLGTTIINVNVPNEYILIENRLEDIVRKVLYASQSRNAGLSFT